MRKGIFQAIAKHFRFYQMEDIQRIGNAFEKLLSQPGLDPEGYCVEWYFNDKDIRCMVRLDNKI